MNKLELIDISEENDKSAISDNNIEELKVLKGVIIEKVYDSNKFQDNKSENFINQEFASTSEKVFVDVTRNLNSYQTLKLKDDQDDEIKFAETNINSTGYNEAQKKLQIQKEKFNKQTVQPSVGFKHSPSFFGFSQRKDYQLDEDELQNLELDHKENGFTKLRPKSQSLKIHTGRLETIQRHEEEVIDRKYSNDNYLINLYNPISNKGQWNRFKVINFVHDKTKVIKMYTDDDSKVINLIAIKTKKRSYDLSCVTDGIEIKVGTIKWNFFGTEFNIYNTGKKPKKGRSDNLRANLGAITYETNLFGSKGPQKIKVYIPKVIERQDEVESKFHSYESNSTLIIPKSSRERIVKLKDINKVMTLFSKPPIYLPKYKCYALDYHGRSIKQSIKNFQLISDPDNILNDEVLLQFGYVGEETYILDFKFPFSKLQAFAIAVSSLEDKMFCE